jgi:hypothetical protein
MAIDLQRLSKRSFYRFLVLTMMSSSRVAEKQGMSVKDVIRMTHPIEYT